LIEIPKETYKGYMNDRSSITRKSALDYSMLLPHNAPTMPLFTTVFSDMCHTLTQCITWGKEKAEKRRRIVLEGEPGIHSGVGGPGGVQQMDGEELLTEEQRQNLSLFVQRKAGGSAADALAPLVAPVTSPGMGGLMSPGEAEMPVMTETMLLENAPVSMNGVVTGIADDEAARVGFSGRTEKMHRYLAKEFQDSSSQDLSYESMCKADSRGRNDLIAGCFFELLVLKTNGVINLKQDVPQSDIKITKARQWAK